MSDPRPTLDQLQVFLAIVEAGSFAGAARRLGRATSVVSYTIANLEAQLGLELFDRDTTRKPTLTEAGVAVDNVDMWYGVLAPKGTPPEVVARLNREIAAVLRQPAVAKSFESQGMVPASSTPAEFGTLIQKDTQRWADVVRRGNITAD